MNLNPGMKQIAQRVQAAQSEAYYRAQQIYTRGAREGVARGLRVGRVQGLLIASGVGLPLGAFLFWLVTR